MHAGAKRFRRLVVEHFGGRPGRGCRYPASLRREAVAVARAALSEGLGLVSVAEELGVRDSTLSRWLGDGGEEPFLRPVEVIAEQDVAGGCGSSVVVVTTSGVRIEGLRIEDVPALVRELGG